MAALIYGGFSTPPDLLLSLDDDEAFAFEVAFGELRHGGTFNFEAMKWEWPKT